MRNVKRNMMVMALLALAAALVAGCGGGGGAGGNTPPGPPTGSFSLSGTILDLGTNTPIRGARVTIGTDTATSDTNGHFTVSMLAAPGAATYSVDLTTATPLVYTYWITANGSAQSSSAITLPGGLGNGSSLGTLFVVAVVNPQTGRDNAPPPPIFR